MLIRGRRLFGLRVLLAGGSLVAVLLQPGIANAATITVDTTDDVSATNCTLRDAITAANNDAVFGECPAGSGNDLIDITATGTINLGSPLPPLTTNIAIDGPGPGLLDVHRQSGGDYRVFNITSTGVVTISDLTISNGRLAGIGQAGAGIANFGTATLDRVTVTGNNIVNTSDSVNPAPGGGGIFNGGVGIVTMTLRRSTVTGNTVTTNQTATSGQTSASATGGGIYNTGSLTIERTTVSGNTVSATVASTDPNASAFGAGGAIVNFSAMVLKLSTLSGNQATATAASPATVTTRGAIYNLSQINVISSTIAFNTGVDSANFSAQGAETVTSSIISNPLGGPNNCDGSFNTDGGFNIEHPTDCAGLTGTNADPLLQPLEDNGGPTQTHELESASPALDAGSSGGETTDQREMTRPVDLPMANAADGSDVGAVEMQVLDLTPPVDPTLDSPSHDPNLASSDPTVEVTWSGASDSGSGVDGFSYEWSTSPSTVPDTTKDAEESATGTTSPPLSDGSSHWFHLRTRDNAGNWTSTVHLGPFVIDTGPPETTITKQPKKKIFTDKRRVRVRFEFGSNEPSSTFLCRLDGRPWAPCTSPTAFKVKRGKHTFSIQAFDQALNADPTPALRRFKVVPRD